MKMVKIIIMMAVKNLDSRSWGWLSPLLIIDPVFSIHQQGCIFRLTCSYPELTSAYVKIFRTVTRNAVNKSVWRKKDCSWLPLNKHAMNISLSSLRIRAHLSWRTGKHLHVLHVLRTYSTCSYPGYQDTTTYAALSDTIQRTIPYNCHFFYTDTIFVRIKFTPKNADFSR